MDRVPGVPPQLPHPTPPGATVRHMVPNGLTWPLNLRLRVPGGPRGPYEHAGMSGGRVQGRCGGQGGLVAGWRRVAAEGR